MKYLLSFVAVVTLSACGVEPPHCETLKCAVEASGAVKAEQAPPSSPVSESVTSTTSALYNTEQANVTNATWAYFGGWGSVPPMQFFFQDCSEHTWLSPAGVSYQVRDQKQFGGACYFSSQNEWFDYGGTVVVKTWLGHPWPSVEPTYATDVVNFLCYAAVRSWGYDKDTALNSCNPSLTPYVANARQWLHDTQYSGTPMWTPYYRG